MFEFEEMAEAIQKMKEYLNEHKPELEESKIHFLEDTIRLMEEDYSINEDCYKFLSQYHRLSHDQILEKFDGALRTKMDSKLRDLEKKGINAPKTQSQIINEMTSTLESTVKSFLMEMEYPEERSEAFAKSYSQVYKITVIANLTNDIN